jgi:hypothetical protein
VYVVGSGRKCKSEVGEVGEVGIWYGYGYGYVGMGIERGMAWCLVLSWRVTGGTGKWKQFKVAPMGTCSTGWIGGDGGRVLFGPSPSINHQPGRYSRMGDRVMELALPLFAISS